MYSSLGNFWLDTEEFTYLSFPFQDTCTFVPFLFNCFTIGDLMCEGSKLEQSNAAVDSDMA